MNRPPSAKTGRVWSHNGGWETTSQTWRSAKEESNPDGKGDQPTVGHIQSAHYGVDHFGSERQRADSAERRQRRLGNDEERLADAPIW